jgi:hypothetical protein
MATYENLQHERLTEFFYIKSAYFASYTRILSIFGCVLVKVWFANWSAHPHLAELSNTCTQLALAAHMLFCDDAHWPIRAQAREKWFIVARKGRLSVYNFFFFAFVSVYNFITCLEEIPHSSKGCLWKLSIISCNSARSLTKDFYVTTIALTLSDFIRDDLRYSLLSCIMSVYFCLVFCYRAQNHNLSV